jgi:hypothetical protein
VRKKERDGSRAMDLDRMREKEKKKSEVMDQILLSFVFF